MLFIAREESTGYVFDEIEAENVAQAIELARNPEEDHIRFEIVLDGDVVGLWDGEKATVL